MNSLLLASLFKQCKENKENARGEKQLHSNPATRGTRDAGTNSRTERHRRIRGIERCRAVLKDQAALTSPDTAEAPLTRPVTDIFRIPEWMRGKTETWNPNKSLIPVTPQLLALFLDMAARAKYERDPWKRIPFPTRRKAYGTTDELFARVKLAVAKETHLSGKDCALLTFWAFSTWFQDVLPVAPGLALLVGPHEGDVVLRTLRAFCYHPVLVVGITSATLNDIDWAVKPTLLISDPNLGKRMAVLLGSSTCRGYLAFRKVPGFPTFSFDYFGSKAIYVGEDLPMKSVLQNYLHINATPAPGIESKRGLPLSEETVQDFQNQLLRFRIENMACVFRTDFNVSRVPPEVTSIANALGGCIVDAPGLRDELVSLLTPVFSAADRRTLG